MESLENYSWVNIFGARRGSTFVFNYLSQHNQISPTNKKEPLNCNYNQYTYYNSKYYQVIFLRNIKKDTRVLLDGTAGFVWNYRFATADRFVDGLNVKDAKFICLFRDPYKALRSFLLMHAIDKDFSYVDEILSGDLRFNSLELLKRVENKFGRDSIYICCIEDFIDNINRLYNFLQLDYQELSTDVNRNDYKKYMSNHPNVKGFYEKNSLESIKNNKNLSWIIDDYKSVDQEFGTDLIHRYNL